MTSPLDEKGLLVGCSYYQRRAETAEAEVKRLTEDNEALRAALGRICENASRRDLHGNGALHDLVMPYLIDEARKAMEGVDDLNAPS